jgi:hypothetical protein
LGWDFVRTFGALALAIASMAAAAGSLLVLTGFTAVARRRARAVSATPDQASPAVLTRSAPRAWSGTLLAKQTAVAALIGMAVTVVAVTVRIPGGKDSGTASTASAVSQLAPTAKYSASPQVTDVMVAAWLHYGGFQRITALSDGFLRLAGAIDQSNAELKHETNKHGLVTDSRFRAAEAPTAAACAAILASARSAEVYFPVPSSPLQQRWRSVLTGFSVGAQGCAAGVRKASVAQLNAAFDDIIQAGETLDRLLTLLTFLAGHFCRACA